MSVIEILNPSLEQMTADPTGNETFLIGKNDLRDDWNDETAGATIQSEKGHSEKIKTDTTNYNDYKNYKIFQQTQTPPEILSRHFIVDCSGFTFIDLMGVSALKQIFSEMRKRGIPVYFAGAKAPVRDLFEKCKFFEFVPKENFYPTMRDANSIARMRQLELGFQDGGYVPEHDRISEVISSHPM